MKLTRLRPVKHDFKKQITLQDGTLHILVELRIDTKRLAALLGYRAYHNKNRRSRLRDGIVEVKVIQ